MKLAAMLLALLLAACADSFIHPSLVARATEWCAPHGGLQGVRHEVLSQRHVRLSAVCNNGMKMEQTLSGGSA